MSDFYGDRPGDNCAPLATATRRRLWISNRGEVACEQHGGYYLQDAATRHPDHVKITTPLDAWVRSDVYGDPADLCCETCSR